MKFRLVGVVAFMALVVASCGGGSPEAAGPSEGIQVHGDWTIDVYNDDGTLDQHAEFANALSFGGENTLAGLLAQETAVGYWTIRYGMSGDHPCTNGPTLEYCHIEQDPAGDREYSTANLIVVRNGTSISLSGSHTATRDGMLDSVDTSSLICNAGETVPCFGQLFNFTEASDLADPATGQPYQIADGQTVQIQVDISFTSG